VALQNGTTAPHIEYELFDNKAIQDNFGYSYLFHCLCLLSMVQRFDMKITPITHEILAGAHQRSASFASFTVRASKHFRENSAFFTPRSNEYKVRSWLRTI